MENTMTIAIISAMAEENASLLSHMNNVSKIEVGRRVYLTGELWGQSVVTVFSHWGKVAAASTVTHLISCMDVQEVIFTGVAGGIHENLNIGDIVIAKALYQHDMDASPIIPRHEIPLMGVTAIEADATRRLELQQAAEDFVGNNLSAVLSTQICEEFALHSPKVVTADIASGDQFISSNEAVQDLRERLPSVACVEMEGAAIAQVCHDYDMPFSVVRTISDAANDSAHIDFPKFIEEVAQVYTLGILRSLLQVSAA